MELLPKMVVIITSRGSAATGFFPIRRKRTRSISQIFIAVLVADAQTLLDGPMGRVLPAVPIEHSFAMAKHTPAMLQLL